MSLKVLVTGYPNSGTSFLCNLVVAMGMSPGENSDLKSADSHNQYGYYENLKLRKESWKVLGEKPFKPWEGISNSHIKLTKEFENIKLAINEIIKNDKIEVYKDNALPLNHKLFPSSKIIVIERDPQKIYESPQKGGHSKMNVAYETFLKSLKAYKILVEDMSKDKEVLIVSYENFFIDFTSEIKKILDFLELNDCNINTLQEIFKPRDKTT